MERDKQWISTNSPKCKERGNARICGSAIITKSKFIENNKFKENEFQGMDWEHN